MEAAEKTGPPCVVSALYWYKKSRSSVIAHRTHVLDRPFGDGRHEFNIPAFHRHLCHRRPKRDVRNSSLELIARAELHGLLFVKYLSSGKPVGRMHYLPRDIKRMHAA